jgi:NADPH2 dehydrogenase
MTIDIPSRLEQPVTLAAGSPYATKIHRVALAPLTRMRNTPGTQAPTELAVEYYSQRASKNGLLITEATFIAEEAGGFPLAPGVYTEEQVEKWKKVVEAVHAKESLIWVQGWALGRANAGQQSNIPIVAPSAIGLKDNQHSIPKEMSIEDIDRYVEHYKTAAQNALKAGFDGFEVHNANGYLLDQFLQNVSNKRTDAYGGSLENRARFTLRAIEAVVQVYGQERVGIRFSPWGRFQDMLDDDPYEIFVYVNKEIAKRYPKLGVSGQKDFGEASV